MQRPGEGRTPRGRAGRRQCDFARILSRFTQDPSASCGAGSRVADLARRRVCRQPSAPQCYALALRFTGSNARGAGVRDGDQQGKVQGASGAGSALPLRGDAEGVCAGGGHQTCRHSGALCPAPTALCPPTWPSGLGPRTERDTALAVCGVARQQPAGQVHGRGLPRLLRRRALHLPWRVPLQGIPPFTISPPPRAHLSGFQSAATPALRQR